MSNHVTIRGANLTGDPELRFTPNGKAVCGFSVADNRRWLNTATQQWEEEASFFDVVMWGDAGEAVATTLKRGDRVVIDGTIRQERWETPEGDKRSKVKIVAESVALDTRFLATVSYTKTAPKDGGGHGHGARPPRPAAEPPAGYDEEPF